MRANRYLFLQRASFSVKSHHHPHLSAGVGSAQYAHSHNSHHGNQHDHRKPKHSHHKLFTYHEATKHTHNRSLVVISGWLGAKEKHLQPYVKFYQEKGIDAYTYIVSPDYVMKPQIALDLAQSLLQDIEERFHPSHVRPVDSLLFHNFSVGGFLYGQMLRVIADSAGKYDQILPKIGAQIFDSPPDFDGIAAGISRSVQASIPVQKAIELCLRGILKITENTSGVHHRAASVAFHDNMITSPAMWFYSKADPVTCPDKCEEIVQKWKNKGMQVESCVWEDTPHVQHARFDPERYFMELEKFLINSKVIEK